MAQRTRGSRAGARGLRYGAAGLLLSAVAMAAPSDDTANLLALELDELAQFNVLTSIATGVARPQRENPAIITLITAAEIRAMQARDLIDIIQRVPGFQIATDGNPGALMVRGLSGYEGRALFMVDGLPLSDFMFGAYELGNDFPIHLIERIEIIRGPGSVVYGGAAEIAVINLVTQKSGNELRARYGALPHATGHRDLGGVFSGRAGDWHWHGLAFLGEGLRSDADFQYFGQLPPIRQNQYTAGIESQAFGTQLDWRNRLSLKLLWQYYSYNRLKGFSIDPSLSPAEQAQALQAGIIQNRAHDEFANGIVGVSALITRSDRLDSTLDFSVQQFRAFDRANRDDVTTLRSKLANTTRWRPAGGEWLFGAELIQDAAHIEQVADTSRYPHFYLRENPDSAPARSVDLYSGAAFLNWSEQFADLNAFAGARYDWSDHSVHQLSPRLGLTRQGAQWHWKLVGQRAFRAPLVANGPYSRSGYDPAKPWREPVTPESSTVLEVELGYLPNEDWFVTGNLFYQQVKDIIEYRFNTITSDLYSDNGGKLATYGAELELRGQVGGGHLLVNASYAAPRLYHDDNPFAYAAQPKGGDTYLALHKPDELLGVSKSKLYAHADYPVGSNWLALMNVTWLGHKNGAAHQPYGVTDTLPSQTIVDVGAAYDQLHWTVGLSIHDLTNQRLNLVVPYYDSGFDTAPYKGREFSVDWQWRF